MFNLIIIPYEFKNCFLYLQKIKKAEPEKILLEQ